MQVGSQVSGNIQKLFADFNSPVKAGEVDRADRSRCFPGERHAGRRRAGQRAGGARARAAECDAHAVARREAKLRAIRARPGDGDAAAGGGDGEDQGRRARKARRPISSTARSNRRSTGMVISRNVDVGQTVAASLRRRSFSRSRTISRKCRSTRTSRKPMSARWRWIRRWISRSMRSRIGRSTARSCRCATRRHGAERCHLRHRHRRQQSRAETEARHDRERLDRHRAAGRRLEDPNAALRFRPAECPRLPTARSLARRAPRAQRERRLAIAARRTERTVYCRCERRASRSRSRSRRDQRRRCD